MRIWINNEEEMQALMSKLDGYCTWKSGSRASDYPKLLHPPVAIELNDGIIFWVSCSVYNTNEEKEAYIRGCIQAKDVLSGNVPLACE